MRGLYLALEGVEGSGKSTIAAALADRWAHDREVVVVREPGGTDLGEEVRRLVLHAGEMDRWAEAALFAAARAQLVSEVVGPALDRGAWVVSDRSYYSSLAYQGAGRGLGIEAVRVLNESVLHGITPDVVVVLEVDPEVGFAREVEPDRIGTAGVRFQQTVADGYRTIAAKDPIVRIVDASGTTDQVTDLVAALVEAAA